MCEKILSTLTICLIQLIRLIHLISKPEKDKRQLFRRPCRKVFFLFFFLNWRTRVLFVGPLIPLFWTSGDVSYGFQSQSGQPYLCLAEIHLWCDTCQPPDGQHGS